MSVPTCFHGSPAWHFPPALPGCQLKIPKDSEAVAAACRVCSLPRATMPVGSPMAIPRQSHGNLHPLWCPGRGELVPHPGVCEIPTPCPALTFKEGPEQGRGCATAVPLGGPCSHFPHSGWASTAQTDPARLRLTQQHIPGGEGLSQTPGGLSTPGAFPSLDPFAFSCGDSAGVAPVGLSWGSSAGFIPLFCVLWGLC